ncbi:MerR family transcriptional regulator, partial [Pseudomonas aeruginosa]|uniref:MerR family transcriptional regulator n=1 Tax=Pseudomonas aeruginosa TaxID=287 RepID=UPI0039699C0A
MRIGELGKKADCLVQTVRFYESEGLLPEPARSEGNFRLYDEVHLQRLLFIRRCRAKALRPSSPFPFGPFAPAEA